MKKYTLTFKEIETGLNVEADNHGYNAFEILGLLKWKLDDIEKQINGEIKPDIVKRRVHKEDKKNK